MQVYKNEFSVLDGMQVMVRRDGGKLFQMSGLQTVNARRPKSVALSVGRWLHGSMLNAEVVTVALTCRR